MEIINRSSHGRAGFESEAYKFEDSTEKSFKMIPNRNFLPQWQAEAFSQIKGKKVDRNKISNQKGVDVRPISKTKLSPIKSMGKSPNKFFTLDPALD